MHLGNHLVVLQLLLLLLQVLDPRVRLGQGAVRAHVAPRL